MWPHVANIAQTWNWNSFLYHSGPLPESHFISRVSFLFFHIYQPGLKESVVCALCHYGDSRPFSWVELCYQWRWKRNPTSFVFSLQSAMSDEWNRDNSSFAFALHQVSSNDVTNEHTAPHSDRFEYHCGYAPAAMQIHIPSSTVFFEKQVRSYACRGLGIQVYKESRFLCLIQRTRKSNDVHNAWCFGWEIPTITNEEAAWCYVITNINNKQLVTWTNQNAPI
jgi:hypothetical protein